jgi:N-acetylglucosaminyldiphosphoundecaprenol N-acetyl-beta-D-mannosaminyltransferase
MSYRTKNKEQKTKNKEIPFVTILGIRVSAVSKKQTLAWIEKWVKISGKKMVVTPNPEQVVLAQKDRYFREILNKASLALCDGEGLLWAVGFLGEKPTVPERVTGEEVMKELVKMAAAKGWKVFLLGGKPGVAQKAGEKLKISNEKLKIRASSGAENIWQETDEERKRIISEINRFKPDLLFVAYGAPWQEKWLARNLDKLDIKIGMVVGGALDMIVDPTLRPARFMTNLGLDWLYRLVRQPWRIKRQLALAEFVYLALKSKVRGNQVPVGT